jgi:hypothetical protein
MRQAWIVAAGVFLLPSSAVADPGSYDKEFYRNLYDSRSALQDGRMDAMIAEGRANKKAFDDLKAREASQPAAAPSSRGNRARPR